MTWRNDPALGAVPAAGTGSVDIAERTRCGEAVTFDGTDVQALIDFVGDATLVMVDGKIYQRREGDHLHPVVRLWNLSSPVVVVRPPAGDWFVLSEAELMQQFAIVVHLPTQISYTVTTGSSFSTVAPVKKPAPKKAPTKKVAAHKK